LARFADSAFLWKSGVRHVLDFETNMGNYSPTQELQSASQHRLRSDVQRGGSSNFCAFSFSRFLGAAESTVTKQLLSVTPKRKSHEFLGTSGAEVNEAVSKRQYADIIK
jgi:hypothetical protein